ncbi:MAG: DUF169 domain-containing protein [Desulfotomaculales bacterium]
MLDFREANHVILRLLRVDTYPLAVKFVSSEEEFPSGAKRTGAFGIKIAICQATSMARKLGWAVAVTPGDINCASGLVGFGWGKLKPGLNREEELANFLVSAGYVKDRDRAKKTIDSIPYLKEGYESPYAGLVISPLEYGLAEDPDVVLIYGNAAQVSRMVQAYVYVKGGVVKSESQVGLSCGSEMIRPMMEKSAFYIVPGRGERSLGMAGNDEMAFALPGEQLADFLTGLKETHEAGSRYPISQYLFFEPAYTPAIIDFRNKILSRG